MIIVQRKDAVGDEKFDLMGITKQDLIFLHDGAVYMLANEAKGIAHGYLYTNNFRALLNIIDTFHPVLKTEIDSRMAQIASMQLIKGGKDPNDNGGLAN